MNRETRRREIKTFRERERRYINDQTLTVLAAGAEFINLPLDYIKAKFISSEDKGKFIEDVKYIVEMIKAGQYEFDTDHNFVKVESDD